MKMIAKVLLMTFFAICQAASREPWWIQMFFPNVEFTGKYHPSNYKVEKSPLFPDYVQNPNDVWSPAYWMPYKQAYAQYWIDLIENSTRPEPEMSEEVQAQTGNQYGVNGQFEQEQAIAEQASTLAQQVQTQAQNMNAAAQQIVSQAQEEAERQQEAIVSEANQLKEQVEAELGSASSEAQMAFAEIDRVAEAKVEAISRGVAQFEEDVKSQFAPLNEKAQEIAVEAAEIAEEIEPQL